MEFAQLPAYPLSLPGSVVVGTAVFIILIFLLSVGRQVWIFDGPGGTGHVLRSRMGHSAPPTKIRYHGQNGEQILSAGMNSNSYSV